MTKAADEGSIIIVNVTSLRSDVIAVSSTGFRLVRLLHVDAVQAQNWVNQELTTTSSNDRGVKNKAYREFLAWLWQKCVKSVLNELDYHVQSSPEHLPRVWWIGTSWIHDTLLTKHIQTSEVRQLEFSIFLHRGLLSFQEGFKVVDNVRKPIFDVSLQFGSVARAPSFVNIQPFAETIDNYTGYT